VLFDETNGIFFISFRKLMRRITKRGVSSGQINVLTELFSREERKKKEKKKGTTVI